jgi:hypothetical protein
VDCQPDASPWTLIAYRAPASPSTSRVSAWRSLHRLGAVYLGPSVCLLPTRLAEPRVLDDLATRVTSAGGSFDVLPITAFEPQAEAIAQARYNEARDAEYAEVVERAEAVGAELAREAAHDKYTFAEVEENEADLARLRRWLRRVVRRDLFGASARGAATAAIERAEAELATFIEQAMAREGGGGVGMFDKARELPGPAPDR